MKIYIDNEEVLCNSKMTIKEPLRNTKSVILNNVYPKEWEQDKDYVSKFYMPKDYSKVKIEDNEHAPVNTYYSGTLYFTNRYADYETKTIVGESNNRMLFSAVYSNIEYTFTANNTSGSTQYIFQADGFAIGQELSVVAEIPAGESEIKFTPTKQYVIFNTYRNGTEILSYTLKEIGKYRIISLLENVMEIEKRLLRYSDSTIRYNENYSIKYFKVTPGRQYKIGYRNNLTSTKYICETDNLAIGTQATRVQLVTVANGSFSYYTIKPTKKYILVDGVGEFISIQTMCNSGTLFNGYIKNSGNINLNPRHPHYSTLQALDYSNFLNECDTLNYVLDRQNVSSAIKRVTEELDGFYIGTMALEEDSEIAPYNCNEKTPADVFDYLAEVTGSIWYTSTQDEDITFINFRSPDNCEQLENIEYNEDYFRNNEIVDIKYSYNSNDYRNKQVIINEQAISGITQKENVYYNGGEIKTTYPISSIVSIKVGTKSYSVASNIAKKNGTYAKFYYTYGKDTIEVNGSLATGIVLTIEYYTIVNSRQVAYNQTETERIKNSTNRNGIIARYEKRTDTDNELNLSQIAQTYLDYKGVPEITLTIKTTKDIIPIMGGRKLFFEAPIEDLKTNYLVIGKQVDMIVTGDQQVIFYTYTLSSSFNDENAINYFDNQRRKLEGTIQEGEYISRYIELPSTTNIIFYDVTKNKIEVPGDILDGELDIELLGNSGNTLNSKLNFVL